MTVSKQKAGVGATPQLNVELAEELNPYQVKRRNTLERRDVSAASITSS